MLQQVTLFQLWTRDDSIESFDETNDLALGFAGLGKLLWSLASSLRSLAFVLGPLLVCARDFCGLWVVSGWQQRCGCWFVGDRRVDRSCHKAATEQRVGAMG